MDDGGQHGNTRHKVEYPYKSMHASVITCDDILLANGKVAFS